MASLESPAASTSLVELDRLDDALEAFLDAVDEYQTAQESLAAELKKAFFDLARAKVAIGPSRLGQDSYDLSAQQALRTLRRLSAEGSDSPRYELVSGDATDPSSSAEPSTKSQGSQLRQRKAPTKPSNSTGLPSPPPSNPPSPSPSSPTLRDPAHQFAAFPPPALRSSQKAFERALERAVRLVEVRERVVEREGEVRRLRAKASGAEG